jgi:hypothetical protein
MLDRIEYPRRTQRKSKEKKRSDSTSMDCNETQVPASEYQKTVINYQNDDECFKGKNYSLE